MWRRAGRGACARSGPFQQKGGGGQVDGDDLLRRVAVWAMGVDKLGLILSCLEGCQIGEKWVDVGPVAAKSMTGFEAVKAMVT